MSGARVTGVTASIGDLIVPPAIIAPSRSNPIAGDDGDGVRPPSDRRSDGGKPELKEFSETETVEAAIRAVARCAEGSIPVWRRRQWHDEARADRFVGILSSMDLVAFLTRAGPGTEAALRAPVSEVVAPNQSLLKEVDPGTRLIDTLEMMKHGVRHLLVRKSVVWRGISKRFSILYNGKWLKNIDTSASTSSVGSSSHLSLTSIPDDKYCCLSREDVVRFLICCLGALAPIPLSSISALGAITLNYSYVGPSASALEAIYKLPQDPCAVAVVETNADGTHEIIGEISAYKLWKCDYIAAAWAMANLSAGQFVMGTEDEDMAHEAFPNFPISSASEDNGVRASPRPRKLSSGSVGFLSNQMSVGGLRPLRSMYRVRSTPLTCKHTSSLAAVMAQMLSHRATHVWVTQAEDEDILVGVVSYTDILFAVTKHPNSLAPSAQ